MSFLKECVDKSITISEGIEVVENLKIERTTVIVFKIDRKITKGLIKRRKVDRHSKQGQEKTETQQKHNAEN